jgi:hypothetical protein
LDTHVYVGAHPCFGDTAVGHSQKISGRYPHIFAPTVNLVGRRHILIENSFGDGHQARVRYPGAIVPIGNFAQLVSANPIQGDFVSLGIIFDGDLGRHATHGMNAPFVAGLDE